MATTFDEKDAIARARAEIDLELNRWKIRLKDAAIRKVQLTLSANDGADPVEVARAAALEALDEGFYNDADQKALSSGN